MNTLDELVAAIRSLVLLQNKLLHAFKAAFPHVDDWKLLLDFPKTGKLIQEGEEWSFRKHGSGLSFTNAAGTTVDIHRGLLNPDAIDAWRLVQYLESIGLDTEPPVTERDVEARLRQLCQTGKLEALDAGMFRLAEM